MDTLSPKTHQEAVAVFRHGLIGALTQAQMDRGQLRAALEQLSHQRFLPPRGIRPDLPIFAGGAA